MGQEDIAYSLQVDAKTLARDLDVLLKARLVSDVDGYLVVTNFAKRQDMPQSVKREQWRERQAQFRARRKASQDNSEGVTRESRVTGGDGHAGVIALPRFLDTLNR